MGLLDNILGGAMGGGGGGGLGGMLGGGMMGRGGMGMQPRRGGGMGQTLAAGVLLALLVKAARQHAAPQEGRSFDPGRQGLPQQGGGGMGGGLGGILGGMGGGGMGGMLGGLGGAGALGGLIRQMQQKGYGQQVNSWVDTGPNQQIQPNQLADALGDETVQELQQQTGLPREQLLSQLAHELPDAINEATPSGQLPDDDQLHSIASGGR